jgi:tetratricopeptide (TPR) repeat protein
MLYIAAVASCTLLFFLPLVGLAVRPRAIKDPALAGGTLFLMVLAAGSLWAADSLVQAEFLLPALRESIFALMTFQPSEIVPVGAPPHWAAWIVYLLVAFAGACVPVLLSRVNAAGGRAAAGVVLGVGILVMAVLSYQRTGAWQSPEDLWGQYADDAGALETLGLYYRHAAAGAPDNDETLALLRRSADRLDQATRLDPENGARHAVLGQTLLELGDVQGANASLRAALRHAPFHRDAHLALSQLLATRAATAGDMTVLEEARRHLEAASAVAPLEPPYQLQQAGMMLQLGQYREAAELIAAIPEEALPEQAGSLLQQARAATGRVQQLRQNALQNAGDATAAVGQAEAALLSGKLQSAYYMLERFMQQAPDNANAWELLGVVKAEAGETETFISKWGTAPAASGEGWRRIATRVLSGGNWDAATVFLAQDTGTDPKALETRIALAKLAVAANRLNDAGLVLQQAAEAFPDSPAPWLALAEIAEQLQQGDAAARFRGEANKRQGSAGKVPPPTQEAPNNSNSTTTPQLPPMVEIR